MNCEMCGSKKAINKTNIEGAVLSLCSGCSSYGEVIERIKPKPKKKEKTFTQSPVKQETILLISKDYSKKIKNKREKLGLKQEEFAKKINEKESLIRKIESGTTEPNLDLARRIEKFLKIKIVKAHKEQTEYKSKTKAGPVTIGDLITIKKN
ncbi:MAG: hypothetical protein MAG795_00978 [Candidatus Woesearchaeota archaeon]|nr:hypothetical protein [Candidatus Woesearchaeota archaeon]